MTATRPLLEAALRLAAGALASLVLGAVLVAALGAGAWTRDQLDFRFAEPARRADLALATAASNARLAAAALLAASAVQRRPSLRAPLDSALGLLAAANLGLIGAAVGAYGRPLLESVALHGPLELAAFAVCGAAYLTARRQQLTGRTLVAASGISFALLALAAAGETYVQIGAGR
jgi:hypothetical protein